MTEDPGATTGSEASSKDPYDSISDRFITQHSFALDTVEKDTGYSMGWH